MALKVELEIARADMNDSYGVTLWQHKKQVEYTTDEARELAREIAHAADEADRVAADDLRADLGRPSVIVDASGGVVL